MTAPASASVAAIYMLPVPIWVTNSCLGETYQSGINGMSFDVIMPRDPSGSNGAPYVEGLEIPEVFDGHPTGWTEYYAATIPDQFSPATALIRILINSVEAPKNPGKTWKTPDHLLAEQANYWFDGVRTWVEVLTGQDLDPNHRLYDAETLGAGLTFIEPKHDGPLGMRLTTSTIYPVTPDKWAIIMAEVSRSERPPLEHILLRDARASSSRGFYRRAVIDAAAAVEIALSGELERRLHELPETQRKRMERKPSLGTQIDIAKASGISFRTPYKDLHELTSARNDAVHRAAEPGYIPVHLIIGTATSMVLEINPI